MSLPPPPTVDKLQTALHTKAKGSPDYRFYSCTTRCTERDALGWAYPLSCQRRGSGVDGQTFEDIEAYGLDRWLDELADNLRKRTYSPRPVRRCTSLNRMASKGRWASLASWTAWRRWRRCWSWSRSSRPTWSRSNTGIARTNALDAVRQVERLVRGGHTEVVDGDLSGYFDAIPHAELLKSLSRPISDRFVLKLIKMWLEAPVEETDARGHRHRTTRNKDEGRGSPQGSPISPLLSTSTCVAL